MRITGIKAVWHIDRCIFNHIWDHFPKCIPWKLWQLHFLYISVVSTQGHNLYVMGSQHTDCNTILSTFWGGEICAYFILSDNVLQKYGVNRIKFLKQLRNYTWKPFFWSLLWTSHHTKILEFTVIFSLFGDYSLIIVQRPL